MLAEPERRVRWPWAPAHAWVPLIYCRAACDLVEDVVVEMMWWEVYRYRAGLRSLLTA